jgi:hypothetical protein
LIISEGNLVRPTVWFLFAHQDDEFGVFAEVERLVRADWQVYVCYLTSGSRDGKPFRTRDEESLAVLGKLGVPDTGIHFLGRELGLPDGRLCEFLPVAFRGLSSLLKRHGRPQRLYMPAWEGGHQDHDAVHLLGRALASRLAMHGDARQFPLYTGQGLPFVFFKMFACLPSNGVAERLPTPWKDRIRYCGLCFDYPSQKRAWLGLFPFFLLHQVLNGDQMLQPLLSAPLGRPHQGALLYERRGFYDYEKFVQCVIAFKPAAGIFR